MSWASTFRLPHLSGRPAGGCPAAGRPPAAPAPSPREAGIFAGSDEELLERCRDIAERLGVPATEIAEASVLQVMNSVGTVDASGAVRVEEPQKGERYARITRAIDGVPVFTSGVMLALDREGGLGFLELHWPDISPAVVDEARTMRAEVERGWKPPELAEAQVESVEVGVVHSPAVAFVLDVRPVIRVVYASLDREVGKKPVLFLDSNGRPVSLPRTFERREIPVEKARERAE